MKGSRRLVLMFTLAIFIVCSLFLRGSFSLEEEDNMEVETLEKKRFRTLEKALLSSPKFANSKIEYDSSKQMAIVDGKFDVFIRAGNYRMQVRDKNLERGYCEIVDAIEVSLGLETGKSMETCLETLKGSINIGGISAEIYDTYKVLTVHSDEVAQLYNISNSHVADELISVDEINYNIKIDNYLFSSMTTQFMAVSRGYSICGHVFNDKKRTGSFTFEIFDEKRESLGTTRYEYKNDTLKYLPFCVEYALEQGNVKYYSIKKD